MKTVSKIVMICFLGTSLMLINYLDASAQEKKPLHRQMQNQQRDGMNQRQKIESQKVAFFSQRLQLTPAEAKSFWPIYDEYDAKRHELRKSFRNASDLTQREIDNLTEQEARQAIENQLLEAQKLLDLRKEYNSKFNTVLPDKKILLLYIAERDFQKMLIDKLRQNREKK